MNDETKGIGALSARQTSVLQNFAVELEGVRDTSGGLPTAHGRIYGRTPWREVGDRLNEGKGNIDEMPGVIKFQANVVGPIGGIRHDVGLAFAAEPLLRAVQVLRLHGVSAKEFIDSTGSGRCQMGTRGKSDKLV